MYLVSSLRLSIPAFSMIVAAFLPGWIVAQEVPADGADRPVATVRIPGKISKLVKNEIIPAMTAGDDVAFLNAAMPILSMIKPDVLGALEEVTAEHGLESIQSRFVDLVLTEAEQGRNPKSVVADFKTSRIVFDGLLWKLNEFADDTLSHEVMSDPVSVPNGFHESERFFWDLHVLHNQYLNIVRSIPLGHEILIQHKNRLTRQNEWEQLNLDLASARARLVQSQAKFKERAAALRLQRFKISYDVLLNDEIADFEHKLTSTMELGQDGSVLLSFLENNPANLTIDSLREAGLEAKIQSMLQEGRQAAGDIAEKSVLFRNGLHYWTRGRYGSGPQVYGLVKHRDAMDSVEAMEALYMPAERKLPISNYHSEEESVPGYDRRHYYTWAAEYRPIVERTGGTSTIRKTNSSLSDFGPATQTNSQRFL